MRPSSFPIISWAKNKRTTRAKSHNLARSQLLLLPREIRDTIYSFVCQPDNTNPSVPKCNNTKRIAVYRDDNRFLYPNKYPHYILLSLVQTCKFLRDEVLDYFIHLHHSNSNSLAYKLEIAVFPFAFQTPLLPTFTHLLLPPTFYDTIPRLDVDLRILTHDTFDDAVMPFATSNIHGHYTLLQVLSDYFHHGPQLYYDSKLVSIQKPIVEELKLNISIWRTTDRESYDEIRDERLERAGTGLEGWASDLIESERFLGFVDKVVVEGSKREEFLVRRQDSFFFQPPSRPWDYHRIKWGATPSRRLDICRCDKSYENMGDVFSAWVKVKGLGHIKVRESDLKYGKKKKREKLEYLRINEWKIPFSR
ncbi:hypothetical protein TWF694_007770 [Orbilia ellipsospora]|uniref:F-box domain-containing protein n=1 Tax=Orbilia ellipsospora TaxID=2528407 RepID=A0AAV9XQD6_9PEZI